MFTLLAMHRPLGALSLQFSPATLLSYQMVVFLRCSSTFYHNVRIRYKRNMLPHGRHALLTAILLFLSRYPYFGTMKKHGYWNNFELCHTEALKYQT